MTNFIRTCLWFRDGRGKEAAEFYCGLIPGSRVEKVFTGDASFHPDRSGVDLGRNTGSGRIGPALAFPDRQWRRRERLRLAEGPLRRILAGLPQAADRTDNKFRQGGLRRSDGGDDEAEEDRYRRNRGSSQSGRLIADTVRAGLSVTLSRTFVHQWEE